MTQNPYLTCLIFFGLTSCTGEHRVFLLVPTATLCREQDPALGLFFRIVDIILLLQLLVLHINN